MKKLYLILSLTLIKMVALGQSDSMRLADIANKLEKLTVSQPTEKIYLHFNKPDYAAGDTVWFKAYVTIGPHHQPSALSGVIYIELINDRDKIVKSIKLQNLTGTSAGHLMLDDKVVPGIYRVRAYTNWMRNDGPDYFFLKTFNISDKKTNAVFVTANVEAATADKSLNTNLIFTDRYGRPIDQKAVTYEVKADTTTIYQGSGNTNSNGKLSIGLTGKIPAGQKNLRVISHIKFANGTSIVKATPLNFERQSADVQFFPEGGQLVSEVRSKVAFKALGTDGLAIDIKGVIIDNDKNEVAYFTSGHGGMGVFALTPQPGKTYTAKVTLPNHATFTIPLPAVQPKGFVLSVNNSDSLLLSIKIATNAATLQENPNSTLLLVGQCRGVVNYTTLSKLSNLVVTATVSKSRFPSGVEQFTLFNAQNEPLNERVTFMTNSVDLLEVNAKTDKDIYHAKEQVNLTISAKDQFDMPAEGSFSLSVFSETGLNSSQNTENSILSNILLTSDLRGYIEDPDFYFNVHTDETQAALDVLMLTQGYRRFNWRNVLAAQTPPATYKPEKSLTLSGTLTTSKNKPVINGRLKVLALADRAAIDTVTDTEGKFAMHDVDFTDSVKLVIEARKGNDGRNVNISLDNNHTIPTILKSNPAAEAKLMQPPYQQLQLKGLADTAVIAAEVHAVPANGRQLKEVKVTGKKDLPPSVDNKYGTVYQYHMKMADARNYTSVYDALMWKVPTIQMKIGKLFYESKIPVDTIFVNGVGFNIGYAKIINPDDVESITVAGSTPFITTKAYAGTDTVKIPNVNSQVRQLKQINITANKKAANANAPWMGSVSRSANLNGPGNADYIFTAKDLQNCFDLVTCVINRIPGVTRETNGSDETYYLSRHQAQSLTMKVPIKFMLDGLILSDTAPLTGVDVREVESVEVLTGSTHLNLYGSEASGGLIIITTKLVADDNGGAFAFKSVPGVIYTRFSGFQKQREFYTPKYTPATAKQPDTRTAVYWNANLVTDSKGMLSVNYFNSDVKGNYRVVIEGIDNDGKIGRYIYQYGVQ